MRQAPNTNFILLYLAQHGPCAAKQVLRALALHRGKWLHTKTGGHNGVDYFYRNHVGRRPLRGLQFGHKYTTNVPSYIYPGPSPYWYQMSKHGPWALTQLGWQKARELGYKG